MTTD
ncbi:hypothetical protein FOXB_05026 [Fusarium oxysporum f. sp. conglutinans Fo5176]|jgi:SNF2 family DNA or RNA helicase